jgi:hypothetical protein
MQIEDPYLVMEGLGGPGDELVGSMSLLRPLLAFSDSPHSSQCIHNTHTIRPDTLPCLTLTILRTKPRTGAGRRDVLVLLRMALLNNVMALSLFSFRPKCFSNLLAVRCCHAFYLTHNIDLPMCRNCYHRGSASKQTATVAASWIANFMLRILQRASYSRVV